MFSALQNPTGPPLDGTKGTGIMQMKGANYGAGSTGIKSGVTPDGARLPPEGRSPEKLGKGVGGNAHGTTKNNFFLKVVEKKNDPHGLNS